MNIKFKTMEIHIYTHFKCICQNKPLEGVRDNAMFYVVWISPGSGGVVEISYCDIQNLWKSKAGGICFL